jgi:hypothetical protein
MLAQQNQSGWQQNQNHPQQNPKVFRNKIKGKRNKIKIATASYFNGLRPLSPLSRDPRPILRLRSSSVR